MTKINIEAVIKKMNRIFSSESDFKHALAMTIEKEYSDVNVICEYPATSNVEFDQNKNTIESKIHIDLVVKANSKLIPIELKYRTKELNNITIHDDCQIALTEHNAHDDGGYGFWRDVCRINEFINSSTFNCDEGYIIFLTNDPWYKKSIDTEEKKNEKYFRCKKDYKNFDLNETSLASRDGWANGKIKHLEDVPTINAKWEEYSHNSVNSQQGNSKFWYYIAKLEKTN